MIEDPRRDAAHALLDAVAAFDIGLGNSVGNVRAINLALDRLHLTSACRDEASPLIAASFDLLLTTVYTLADDHGASPESVVRTLREHCDRHIYGPDPT